MLLRPPPSILFPYTTLFRSLGHLAVLVQQHREGDLLLSEELLDSRLGLPVVHTDHRKPGIEELDRKSTRLNSSHLGISYAVFCLKKKKFDQETGAGLNAPDL